ncbi:putative monovalent cation/H+ antiporter subunit D [Mycobacteroides abscessus subsp. abscessus]|nr:putative monovalent cation/H+ antiporter subunit D [Mycobacteroides abscessus subsp. abscessus]
MLAPTLGLIAVGVALTIFAGPIIAISDRAAAEVRDRTVYISAVLGGAPR